jgi:hypothetical protein
MKAPHVGAVKGLGVGTSQHDALASALPARGCVRSSRWLAGGLRLPAAQAPSSGTSSSGAPTASPAPTTATGLTPAPRGLTDRLVLQQTRVTAGTPIKGWLVVTYRGRAPINLNRGCRPQYAVVVTNHRFPPDVAFPTDCSTAPFVIKPGQNRLAVTVITTYRMCAQEATRATSSMPACLHGRQIMPSLPPGQYEAVLVGDGLPLPTPAPILVSLAAASQTAPLALSEDV